MRSVTIACRMLRTVILPLVYYGVLLLDATPLQAAVSFTEDFSDNSPGPHMALGAGFGSPTTNFTGDFTITSGDSNRIYLGTTATDYFAQNFTFEATATMPASTSPWGVAFFGMGSHNAAGGVGEPDFPSALAVIRPDTFTASGQPQFETRDSEGSQVTSADTFVIIPSPSSLAHRLRMTWDAGTQQALFEMDHSYTGGPFTSDFSLIVDGSDNGFSAANSRLLLGGGNSLTFDDIVVTLESDLPGVPELSSLVLLGAGTLLLFRKLRRRSVSYFRDQSVRR